MVDKGRRRLQGERMGRWIFLAILLIFSACTGMAADTPPTLHIALRTNPPTIDPNLATDNVSFQVLNQLQEGLTQFDEELNVRPANARTWEVSEDGLTYVFALDPAYHWSDGAAVTARHFYDAWFRLLDPKTASPYAYFLYPIRGARTFNEGSHKDRSQVGIRVLSDLELEVTLEAPLVYFPMVTTFMVTYPIRKDILDSHPRYYSSADHHVANGAYRLVKWLNDDKLVLEKNPHFGGAPKPQIERLVIHIVPEPITELALYLSGELDYTTLTPLGISALKTRPDHQRMSKLRGYYYGFNQKKPPFNQLHWRQALAMALDKTKIPKILRGGEFPTNSWIPTGMFGHEDTIGLPFNPGRAKTLIAQDLKKGPPPRIELHFNSDLINQKIAEWAQNEWRVNLGVHVDLINEEWASYINRLNQDPPSLFRLGWGADFPDPDNFMNLFTSFSGNNHTFWKSKTYDDLIARARGLTDATVRKKIYDEAQALLLEQDTVIVPLFIQTTHYLVNPAIQPLPLNPLDFVYVKKVRVRAGSWRRP